MNLSTAARCYQTAAKEIKYVWAAVCFRTAAEGTTSGLAVVWFQTEVVVIMSVLTRG